MERREAIKRTIERQGLEFVNDPTAQCSDVVNELINDEKANIRDERKPKRKRGNRGKRALRAKPRRGR